MKKKLIFGFIVILIIAFATYQYAYQSHRDIKSEEANFELTASDLIEAFSTDATAASAKYNNKTIAVSGSVTNADGSNITINNAIFAQFSDESIQAQGNITFKGRCIGYDELLEEIKFDQCSITN